jgi:hypothetical protein
MEDDRRPKQHRHEALLAEAELAIEPGVQGGLEEIAPVFVVMELKGRDQLPCKGQMRGALSQAQEARVELARSRHYRRAAWPQAPTSDLDSTARLEPNHTRRPTLRSRRGGSSDLHSGGRACGQVRLRWLRLRADNQYARIISAVRLWRPRRLTLGGRGWGRSCAWRKNAHDSHV